jgi:hypothetical protein
MIKNIFFVKVIKNVRKFYLYFFTIFNFCLVKNRHHAALLIRGEYLKLVIRKGPVSSNDKNIYASEWTWKLSQINDDQWHSYKLFVNYPNKVLFNFYIFT